MIPEMTDPMGQYWDQPADIRQAPMDDQHVLLTRHQVDQLDEYSSSYPSGKYYGKCWKRTNSGTQWLCWYQPHAKPGQIGIGSRTILIAEEIEP